MRSTFLFLLLSLISFSGISAQSLSKRLVSFISSKGDAFFVCEKKLKTNSKGIKKFVYDMTYLVQEDSVTMNFTIVSGNRNDIVSLTAENAELSATASSVQLLYHTKKGSLYEIRTTAKLCYSDIKKLYQSATPVVFNYTDSKGVSNHSTYSASEWKKEKELFDKIFYTINK